MVVARHTVPMLAGSLVQDVDGEHGIVLIMEGKGGKCLSHVHHGCVDAADVNATLSANASGDQGDALKRSDTGRSTTHSGANLRSDLLARVVRSQGPLDSFVADPGTSDAYCTLTASLLRKWSAW